MILHPGQWINFSENRKEAAFRIVVSRRVIWKIVCAGRRFGFFNCRRPLPIVCSVRHCKGSIHRFVPAHRAAFAQDDPGKHGLSPTSQHRSVPNIIWSSNFAIQSQVLWAVNDCACEREQTFVATETDICNIVLWFEENQIRWPKHRSLESAD
jgi:hypothetical protein